MKIKKIIKALILVLSILSLMGCQLAQEDAGEENTNDRLIGIFITREYLDLFDFEGYRQDNIGKISDGEIQMEGHSKQYEGRLYAILKDLTLTDGETGDKTTIEEYVFEDVEGVSYFAATFPTTDHDEGYIASSSDEAISDGHLGIFHGDDEEKISLEGTLYISSIQGGKTYYINPVYQDEDGRVYTMGNSGVNLYATKDEGSAISQTMDETITTIENGKSKEISTSIKISIDIMSLPEKIVIIQMDENNSILSHEDYLPNKAPDKLNPKEETDYIIVETHKRHSDGNMLVTRELFSRDDESLFTFFCREDGIYIKGWTELIW